MKNWIRTFTIADVRRINRMVMDGKVYSEEPASVIDRIVQSSRFTAEDINRAFAEARRTVAG